MVANILIAIGFFFTGMIAGAAVVSKKEEIDRSKRYVIIDFGDDK